MAPGFKRVPLLWQVLAEYTARDCRGNRHCILQMAEFFIFGREQDSKMAKHVIQSRQGAPPQGAYSQGWRAGDFVFVTGTGPIDPVTGKLVGDTIEQQTGQTIDNLAAILQADGASLADVVKVTVHLSDTGLFARYNSVYSQRFSRPYPVRTTVGSDLGHSPGMLIEMDCIAYAAGRPKKRSDRKSRRPKARKKSK
jgi:2-iminobutanoate/2-iminopropanoate deaminase